MLWVSGQILGEGLPHLEDVASVAALQVGFPVDPEDSE